MAHRHWRSGLLMLVCVGALSSPCWGATLEQRVEILSQRADQQLAGRETGAALESARMAVEIAPENPDAWAILGKVQFERGEYAEAEGACRAGLRMGKPRVQILWTLGKALVMQQRPADAVRYLRRAIAGRPDFVHYRRYLGDILWDLGRQDEAAVQYRKSIEIDPAYEGIHEYVGGRYLETGNFDDAVKQFRKALATRPDSVEARCGLGRALSLVSRTDEALAEYHAAIAKAPDFAGAHNDIAYVYAYRGEWDRALEEAQTAVKLEPGNPQIHDTVGAIALLAGDLAQSETHLRKALSLPEPEPCTRATLACCLAMKGETDEARKLMVEATADIIDPEASLDLLYFAGKAHAQLGEPVAAAQLFTRALERWPRFPWATEMRDTIKHQGRGED